MSHGIKRQRESPEKEAARREKEKNQISEYRSLTEDVMTRVYHSLTRLGAHADRFKRSRNDFSKAAFDLTTTLLKKNPEFYTVWNYRRQILLKGLFKGFAQEQTFADYIEIQIRFGRYCYPNYNSCSFGFANILNVIGSGYIVSGVLKCVLMRTGIRNWNSLRKCSRQTPETVHPYNGEVVIISPWLGISTVCRVQHREAPWHISR